MPSSRLNKLEETKSLRSAAFYVVLTLVLVFSIFKWGIPAFINAVAYVGGGGSTTTNDGFKVPPQDPVLFPLADATYSGTIKVSGTAQSGLKIKLILNGQDHDEIDTDQSGDFTFDSVALIDGINIIGLKAIASNGLESRTVDTQVVYDSEAPKLEVASPTDGADYYGQNKNLEIKGTIKEEGVLKINGNLVYTASNGDFSTRITLKSGENPITIVAQDLAGNTVEKSLVVKYNP
jgi:bacillopeptidase F